MLMWCRQLDAVEIRAGIRGAVGRVVLEKEEEDQLERSCETLLKRVKK
jgi:hypothetical protein